MVKMTNIKVEADDLISTTCIDENKRTFFLRFHPSNWEIVDCDVKRDTYVAHAMYRLSKEYEEGTIKDYSVAMWY